MTAARRIVCLFCVLFFNKRRGVIVSLQRFWGHSNIEQKVRKLEMPWSLIRNTMKIGSITWQHTAITVQCYTIKGPLNAVLFNGWEENNPERQALGTEIPHGSSADCLLLHWLLPIIILLCDLLRHPSWWSCCSGLWLIPDRVCEPISQGYRWRVCGAIWENVPSREEGKT